MASIKPAQAQISAPIADEFNAGKSLREDFYHNVSLGLPGDYLGISSPAMLPFPEK